MKYWDWEDWLIFFGCLVFVGGIGYGITFAVQSDNKYRSMCHARGGEVIVGASPKLCRDGNLLINVYKEETK